MKHPQCEDLGASTESSQDVINQILPGRELLKLFPAMESLVSYIPAGDGKNNNLF